jgi:small subunit ribosomal protein S16
MLTIRFNRTGKRNKAQFRIVVQEHTVAPGGRHVEVLGSYDPHTKKSIFKAERIKYWISKGAQVSDTVWNLLLKNSIIEGAKRAVKMKKKPVEAEAVVTESKVGDKKTEEVKAEEKPVAVPEKTIEVNDEVKVEEKPVEKEAPKVEAKVEAEKLVKEKNAE